MSDSYNPMDCSLPGSSVHRVSQARILEWVAISSSRGSSQSRHGTGISCDPCIGRHPAAAGPGGRRSLGFLGKRALLDLYHVTISQKQLDSSILSVVCREFAEPLSTGCGLRPVANPGGGGGESVGGLSGDSGGSQQLSFAPRVRGPGKGLLCPPRGACPGPRICKGLF